MFDTITGFVSKYLLEATAILLAVALVACGVQTLRLAWAQKEMAEHLALDQTATATAVAQGKALGERLTQAINDSDQEYQRGLRDAQVNQGNLLTDLNALNQRLRPTWRCEGSAISVPKDATHASGPSAAERERNESASRVIGAADACDAQVKGLQKVYADALLIINGH